MFDVFPLTQNEILPVILYTALNLVIIAYYFFISEKQIFNLNFNAKLFFFRLEQQNQDELARSSGRNLHIKKHTVYFLFVLTKIWYLSQNKILQYFKFI